MPIGRFTDSFDLPLLLVNVFVLFFLALVYYLHQEDKREGYPLVAPSRKGGRVKVVGFPGLPKPKTFYRPHGLPPVVVPRPDEVDPTPDAPYAGNPNGMPIDDGTPRLGQSIGPGSWVEREDIPDLSVEGTPVFRPLRWATDFYVMAGEADPRGFAVLGCDKAVAGRVIDIWVDTSEHAAKFLEVELDPGITERRAAPRRLRGDAAGEDRVVAALVTDTIIVTDEAVIERIGVEPVVVAQPLPVADSTEFWAQAGDERRPAANSILLPMEFAAVDATRRQVRTGAITAAQFAGVPARRRDVVLTAREENRLRGYYGGGYLWATPARVEPLL